MTRNPVIAIVGRPNVGKSTLFNRMLHRRKALVEDIPGVTRDRIYGSFEHEGRTYDLVDTGGVDTEDPSTMKKAIIEQVQIAMNEADLILVVVDARSGITALDQEIVQRVRPLGKPVILVANKADTSRAELGAHEFYGLGIDDVVPVSAAHGRGMGELLDRMVKNLPPPPDSEKTPAPDGEEPIRITFCGRPNAGKSSMINRILGEERLLVDAVAGTTMDAVEVPFTRQKQAFLLVDTAGLRRKKNISGGLEKLAGMHAISAMENSHVVVLVLDADRGVHEQDAKLAQLAVDRGKALVIAANKWDLVKTREARKSITQQIEDQLRFVEWAPVVHTSTLTGHGLGKLFDAVTTAHDAWQRRIPTAELNRFLEEAVSLHHPPMAGRRPLKMFFMTQPEVRPPLFVVHANRKSVPESYQRYLSNRLREVYPFGGTPLKLVFRSSHGEKE